MKGSSPVRRWRQMQHLSLRELAHAMGQSSANLSQKENGKVNWQRRDLTYFKSQGLSSDFVLDMPVVVSPVHPLTTSQQE